LKRTALAVCLLSCAALSVFGDGGSLIVRKQTGPIVVSVFSAESPIRVGTSDLSVMVQQASDESPVMDAKVMLRLTKTTEGAVTEVAAPASHAKATNKTLYAAQVTLPSQGTWHLFADVTADGTNSEVAANVNVLPPAPPVETYWPYFMLVPFAILLFLFNRWLRRRRDLIRPRVQP
jgi:YtkA-like